jgi:hypothetical protein
MPIGMNGRLAVIVSIVVLSSLPTLAEPSSSHVEKAETAQLNRDVTAANAVADAKYQAAKTQYDNDEAKSDE